MALREKQRDFFLFFHAEPQLTERLEGAIRLWAYVNNSNSPGVNKDWEIIVLTVLGSDIYSRIACCYTGV